MVVPHNCSCNTLCKVNQNSSNNKLMEEKFWKMALISKVLWIIWVKWLWLQASWSDPRNSFCRGWRLRICKTFEMTRTNLWKTVLETEDFYLVTGSFNQIKYIGIIKIPIGTNNWDVELYRNQLENTSYFNFRPHFLFRFQISNPDNPTPFHITVHIEQFHERKSNFKNSFKAVVHTVPQVANLYFSELSGAMLP